MTPSEQIDNMIAAYPDWRGRLLAEVRRLIHEADPEVVEEWKWRGAPVFEDHGIICVANIFKDKVKVVFHSGAFLPDPEGVFNAELDGKQWRTLDIFEGDRINEPGFKTLVQAAIAYNRSKAKPAGKKKPAG